MNRFVKKARKLIFLEHQAETGEVFLNQRRVFTVPSKAGWMFVLLLILLFVTATNYNLNLGLMLTFLLAGCTLINAFLGFRNLAYLHLSSAAVQPVFAGETVAFQIEIHNRRNFPRYALQIGFSKQQTQSIDLAANSHIRISLPYPSEQRGYLAIPRIRLQTWFPLGLLYAWSSWWPDSVALIYPQAESPPPPLPFAGSEGHSGRYLAGNQDISGIRQYQSGDQMKNLAWKHIARFNSGSEAEVGTALASASISTSDSALTSASTSERPAETRRKQIPLNLYTREFSGSSGTDLCLDFNTLPDTLDLEQKLSRLCSWVVQADASGVAYSFKLAHINLPPATGEAHFRQALQALAMYKSGPQSS